MPSTNPDMAHVEALEAENRRLQLAVKVSLNVLQQLIDPEKFTASPAIVFMQAFETEVICRAALKGSQS